MIAKPKPLTVIRSNDKDEFVKKFNSNLPTQEEKDFWKKAGELFENAKKTTR